MEPKSRILELGSGTGRDAIWFTRQGHPVVGSDFCGAARTAAKQATAQAKLRIRYRAINPESLHSALLTGTRFAHDPFPRHIYARGLIDAMAPSGRLGLWRLCSIAGRRGGLTFLEFRTSANRGKRTHFGKHGRTFARPEKIVAEIERHGGRVVEQVVGRGLAPLGKENPEICRLVVSWTKKSETGAAS
jgi:hypothetical protein